MKMVETDYSVIKPLVEDSVLVMEFGQLLQIESLAQSEAVAAHVHESLPLFASSCANANKFEANVMQCMWLSAFTADSFTVPQ
jgi:hypothetical protein